MTSKTQKSRIYQSLSRDKIVSIPNNEVRKLTKPKLLLLFFRLRETYVVLREHYIDLMLERNYLERRLELVENGNENKRRKDKGKGQNNK